MSQIDLPTDFDFQRAGREVLDIEREGLAQLDQYINDDFTRACETIFRCGGKVVVMGELAGEADLHALQLEMAKFGVPVPVDWQVTVQPPP